MTDAFETTQANRKIMIRILRCIGTKSAVFVEIDGEIVVTPATGGTARRFLPGVVQQAVSSGLVRRDHHSLSATPEAAAWLRRAMAADMDDAFAGQHRVAETADVEIAGDRHRVQRNAISSPLAALSRLKGRDGKPYFPEEALTAADRLHADFHRGQINPRITSSWEPRLSAKSSGGAGGMSAMNDFALTARDRFAAAATAMGPELCGVAIDVCCFEKGLEAVERERQWPVRSAKLMLRVALLALARHYSPPARSGHRNHHWKTDDVTTAQAGPAR